MRFLGIDLGWYDKPSGLAALEWRGGELAIASLARLQGEAALLDWVDRESGDGPAMVAVDAPTVIPNQTGSRPAERAVTSAYGGRHAACHAANLGRPFAALTTHFSAALGARGFRHAAEIVARRPGRYQIEVHPHAAMLELFALPRIIKYKKGPLAERAAELRRLRSLLRRRLAKADPPLVAGRLPVVPATGGAALKDAEDRLDAVIAAYVGAHWWWWGAERNRSFGSAAEGFIVIPNPRGTIEPKHPTNGPE